MIRLSGRLRSALVIGIQGIRARKTRTLLSMVSLFLGVLAVVVVEAGAETARQAALSDVELTAGKDGTVVLFVPPDPRIIPTTLDTLAGRTDAVGLLHTDAVIGEPNVTPVNQGGAPFDTGDGGIYGPPAGSVMVQCDAQGVCQKVDLGAGAQPTKGQAIELQLVGLTGDVRQFRPFRSVSGQWLDHSGAPSLSPRLVLNKEAAKGFERYRVPAQLHMRRRHRSTPPLGSSAWWTTATQPVAYVRADELLNWLSVGAGRQRRRASADDDARRGARPDRRCCAPGPMPSGYPPTSCTPRRSTRRRRSRTTWPC